MNRAQPLPIRSAFLLAFALAACSGPKRPHAEPEPLTPPVPNPPAAAPAPVAAPVPEPDRDPTPEEVPLPADYVEQATREITRANMKHELDAIEKELNAVETISGTSHAGTPR